MIGDGKFNKFVTVQVSLDCHTREGGYPNCGFLPSQE